MLTLADKEGMTQHGGGALGGSGVGVLTGSGVETLMGSGSGVGLCSGVEALASSVGVTSPPQIEQILWWWWGFTRP